MLDPDRESAQMRADHDGLKSRKADQTKIAASQSDLMFLSTAFRKSSKLRTISLEAVLYQHPEIPIAADKARSLWVQVWKRALHVYLVTMTAIAQSQLAIEQLHIYSWPWGCSVPAYDIHISMPTLKAKGLQKSLNNLRVLSLNYATRLIDPDQPVGPLALDKKNFLGPAHFLSLCLEIEELDLKHYNLLPPKSSSWADRGLYWSNYENVFDHIAQAVRLPNLSDARYED
ncbi:hypothetical protein MMC28_007666 [Mycoblastus sanguinarius]|nr:hypothetical protein [Mycoblastus sanguinarius]